MRFFLLLILLLTTTTVSARPTNQNNEFEKPIDLKVIPQNFKFIIDENYSKILSKYKNIGDEKKFKEAITKPWTLKKDVIDVDKYNQNLNNFTKCHKSNYEKYNGSELNFNNVNNYKIINKHGIIVKSTNLRIVPTDLPCFKADKIGEYHPFDNYQNSSLYVGSPIFVVASTQDKKWLLVYSHEISNGWVKARDVAFVSNHDIRLYKKHHLSVILKDNLYIKNKDVKLKVGIFLPTVKSSKNFTELLLPKSNSHNQLSWEKIRLKNSEVATMPIKFTKENIVKVGNELINKPYGWGGLHDDRDCSATTKDFFCTFGFYLPRNSGAQINYIDKNKTFDVSKMSNKQKLDFIKKNGVPFKTLIYLPGHIMIYVGTHNNKVIAFHNMWGIRIRNANGEGRNVVGKSVISTSEIGKELKNTERVILDSVTKIGILN